MDGSAAFMLHESDGFRVALISLEVIAFTLVLLLLGVTLLYHIHRHPVINAMLVSMALHVAVFVWPGIYDKRLKREVARHTTLATATPLAMFCAADAVLVRYMQVVLAAFSVCLMVVSACTSRCQSILTIPGCPPSCAPSIASRSSRRNAWDQPAAPAPL
ncbi:hypothetical protein EXIGLDRAFT_210640 [Exidia glandulosa HHB12029]|uniref:Uncharacterized protein n=1 Tax=Exidia glandulosa HHB12029 TaxID=1314781 RepID=A0A165ZZ98_EXIGL|nr:hypothetical protein EXIGLDRAFT_210640 [Exidia glandulosa HHB12029]